MKFLSLIFTAITAVLALPRSVSAADRLPDLGMAQLRDLATEDTADGRRLLRFTTVIINRGIGPFELRGSRPDTLNPDMDVVQRIYNDAGGYREIATDAVMYYAGDGHNHWHVRDLERYELLRLDNGVKVGTGAKHGFCFFDNFRWNLALAGAPQSAVYASCGSHDPAALQVRMGLSRGWGDRYGYTLPDQYIDITALGAGRYRLVATADASNWFQESDETNNATWVDIQIKGNGRIRAVGYGPYF